LVNSVPSNGTIANFAEISAAEDGNGNTPSDIDSIPDNDPNNDGPFQDNATDNANGDEDDSDPALISVVCPDDACVRDFGDFTIIKN